jgi:probable F420-dependent oxidoreductase
MKFGIHLPHIGEASTPLGLATFAHHAEQLGFDSLWASDHVVFPAALAQVFGGRLLDPLTTLAFVAPATRKVKLGTSVLVVPYRDPLALAKTLASLDVLSEGRVIAGVASGWLEAEFQALGLTFADRGRQTDEYLSIVQQALNGAEPTLEHRGAYRTISDVVFAPKPVQRPLPLWVGGNSRQAIRRAARVGSMWHPVRTAPAEIVAGRKILERALLKMGRPRDAVGISVRVPLWFSESLTGTTGEPPLIGKPEELVSAIRRYADAGASHILVDFFLGIQHAPEQAADPQHFIAAMERFADEVMRYFAGPLEA